MTPLTSHLKDLLNFSADVEAAITAGTPLVALESTIITHGMPYPVNLETARAVEDMVRRHGATPATIAILDRKIHVGLDEAKMDALAQAKQVRKLSRADLAHALVTGDTGSTTVAATMLVAALANISVFATGGLGGVHRDYAHSLDLSADLGEFQRSAVTVVCAGAKAILDIAGTLEVLESLGIPVVSVGTDQFPAFWSRSSGLPTPLRLENATQIAALMRLRARLGQSEGLVVANPVPEEHEIPVSVIAPIIERALDEAQTKGIKGKDVTPFLLQKVLELTDGRSLETNKALILENAKLAAEIAVSHAGGHD